MPVSRGAGPHAAGPIYVVVPPIANGTIEFTTSINGIYYSCTRTKNVTGRTLNKGSLYPVELEMGRLLENHVFLNLRKQHKGHIFYYQGTGECVFVVTDSHNKPSSLYQVCLELTDENIQREIGGLRDAMSELHLTSGTIVTLSDEERLEVPEGTIEIVKAYSI